MKNYDYKFLDVHYALIETFLLGIRENIVDISYSVESKNISIQVVLLEGTSVEDSVKLNLMRPLRKQQKLRLNGQKPIF
jgi:hypothetical protein